MESSHLAARTGRTDVTCRSRSAARRGRKSLSDFVVACVRDGVAWRRTQDAFVARAHGVVERAAREGGGLTPDEVLGRLEAQLQAARARVKGAAPPAAA